MLAAVLTRRRRPGRAAGATSRRALRALLRRCLDTRSEAAPARHRRRAPRCSTDPRRLDPRRGLGVRDGASAAVAPVWRRALPWAVAGALGVALVSALVMWAPWRSTPAPTPRRLARQHRRGRVARDRPRRRGDSVAGRNDARVSPRGRTSQPRLFIRKLDQLQATPLAGTEGAVYPFFSPDGQWIAFFAGAKLKKVSVTGGAPVNLCDAESGRGGTWADDDTIIFSPIGRSKQRAPSRAGGRREADAVRHPQPGSDDATLAPGASRRQERFSTRSTLGTATSTGPTSSSRPSRLTLRRRRARRKSSSPVRTTGAMCQAG